MVPIMRFPLHGSQLVRVPSADEELRYALLARAVRAAAASLAPAMRGSRRSRAMPTGLSSLTQAVRSRASKVVMASLAAALRSSASKSAMVQGLSRLTLRAGSRASKSGTYPGPCADAQLGQPDLPTHSAARGQVAAAGQRPSGRGRSAGVGRALGEVPQALAACGARLGALGGFLVGQCAGPDLRDVVGRAGSVRPDPFTGGC